MNRFFITSFSLFSLLATSCQQPDTVELGPMPALSEKERSLITMAHSVEKGGNISGAVQMYKEAIALSGGNLAAHLALARLYLEQGELQQAEEVLLDAKKERPLDPQVNLRLGKLAIQRGKGDEALKYFNTGLENTPDNPDLLNGKGVALDLLSRHKEAQPVYKQALLASNEQDEYIRNNLAMSYIMTGWYYDAIDLLKATDKLKTVPVLRQNLALAYGLAGEMEKARQWGGKDLSQAELKENIRFYQAYRENLGR
jgi:Flp pilus assembly protein TadD